MSPISPLRRGRASPSTGRQDSGAGGRAPLNEGRKAVHGRSSSRHLRVPNSPVAARPPSKARSLGECPNSRITIVLRHLPRGAGTACTIPQGCLGGRSRRLLKRRRPRGGSPGLVLSFKGSDSRPCDFERRVERAPRVALVDRQESMWELPATRRLSGQSSPAVSARSRTYRAIAKRRRPSTRFLTPEARRRVPRQRCGEKLVEPRSSPNGSLQPPSWIEI